jgi:hypothetical protein
MANDTVGYNSEKNTFYCLDCFEDFDSPWTAKHCDHERARQNGWEG